MNKTTLSEGTVLIIDDTPYNVNPLLEFLTTVGFKVLIAEDGLSGIETAEFAQPNLILLDVMMPDMDGFEVCQHLKSQEQTQDIPIIFMTALDETVNKVKGFELGAVDYLTKPFQLQELLARINAHLTLRKLQQQLANQNQQLQQEIAERKQTEAALKAAHERFTTVLDSLEALVYVADMQTYEILFINKYTQKLFDKNDFLGKICWQTLQPGQTQPCRFCTNDKLVTADGQPTGVYTWEFNNPQTNRWYYIQDRAIRWTDGRIVRLEVATDITQRKQVEEALRASEERFELAMRGANDGLWDWNLETNEVYFSPRWKQILGYAEHELSPHVDEFFKLLHPDDQAPTTDKITAYFDKKIPAYEVTFRLQHKDGHYVWILSRGIAVWNEQAKPLRMVGTHVDLTAQKQAEEALSQAKEAAEVANRAKSAFLANMSHELRTPLNGILGYAQILKLHNLNAQQQEGIAVIQRSGEYLLTLINDVLDLSKIEANRIELVPTAFYFDDFLGEMNELFQMRAQQKGIPFHYQPLTQLPTIVHADETRLRQVLINLLGNAVKFTEQGCVTFKVSSIQNPKGQTWKIRFQVEDSGIGISQDELSKIFLPFQQAGERNYQAQGTGLGLAISKKLVEMMDGKLQVNSTLGQGSTFWMELDLQEISNAAPEQTDKHEIIGFDGPPRTLLVVDDKWENRSVLVNLLAPLGFKMMEACDGQESVDKALQTQPDAILMDLMMPVKDGFEATSEIRKIPELKEVVIIAISASAFDFHQQQSQEAGCDDFIAKPFQRDVLLEKLQKHLNLKWIYDKTQSTPSQRQKSEKSLFSSLWEGGNFQPPAIKGPSPEQAAILFEFSLKGDIESIMDYVEKLEQTELQTFSIEIKKLAEEFQINKISDIAKYYREAASLADVSTAVPTAEQAAILFDLAMKGDVYGLRDYLEQLEQNDDKLAPFAKQIRPLAKQFQYDKICEIVQPYMNNELSPSPKP